MKYVHSMKLETGAMIQETVFYASMMLITLIGGGIFSGIAQGDWRGYPLSIVASAVLIVYALTLYRASERP